MLNKDYKDILLALKDEKAKFLLVGAYAMASHGYPRSTMDIDIWVMPSPSNAKAVLRALKRFGASLQDLTQADLCRKDMIFQIGIAPRRIDIITGVTGLEFSEVYERSVEVTLEGISVRILSIDDLIRNKMATKRAKDLADVEALKRLRDSVPSDSSDGKP